MTNQDAPTKVAFLTAGGLAPCLSAAVSGLITEYTNKHPTTEIICYVNGYQGLLLGNYITVTPEVRAAAGALQLHGGSPIGNSRVKLTNVKDCIKRGLVKDGQDPQRVAADQLIKDQVQVLHTIGGDDTNTAAADLSAFLEKEGYSMCVIGLPKTIDNDVFPIRQSLGAWTAAEQGAKFFENVVAGERHAACAAAPRHPCAPPHTPHTPPCRPPRPCAESSANPRMMIVHEVMGRDCGWLTAATAQAYRARLAQRMLLPSLGVSAERLGVHAVYIPEVAIDLEAEAARLRDILDQHDCVNIFISEGAGVKDIVAQMEAEGKSVPRDAFGHVKLDAINPGKYFADSFSALLGCEKVLVQKSGYFARAAPANAEDLELINKSCAVAVEMACKRVPGVVGMDENKDNELRCCEFPRIKGGKHFDITETWYVDMMAQLGQPIVPAQA